MATREEIDRDLKCRVNDIFWRGVNNPQMTGKKLEYYLASMVKNIEEQLSLQGVVIKGQGLGASHPHLANYYTIAPLVEA